jgi:DNA-binding SARP family transcriptional activator/tetratricopeptide (TPR) repeat protein
MVERTEGPRVQVRLLGAFSVSVDGREVPQEQWPGLRSAQLVQLLGLAPGHRLPREQVIDALWPQLDPEAGGANLRKAAHHAREALGLRDAVVLQGGQAILCPSMAIEVDAARFGRRAEEALRRSDSQACAEAASCYGGDLLPGAPYEAWADSARTRLRSRYLELLRASGQWERLAEAEPTDEPAHRELMRRALENGNRPAAIRWYSRLRTALRQALGVSPDPETHALYEQCIAGLQRPAPAFVGRELELAQAAAWLGAPADQRPGGLVVRGEAGLGKSAFCGQLAGLASERGWFVVRVDAAQPDHPYAVIEAAVEQLIRADPALLEAVAGPARSVLAVLSPLASPAMPLQGPLGRHQVIGAFRRLLFAASGEAPTLLVIDDAHRMGDADADAMLQIAATGRPVHVALATRTLPADSTLGRGVSRLVAAGRLAAIDLAPLADEEAKSLIEQAAPQALAAPVVERIVRLSQGNPFSALELARCAAPEGASRLPASTREAITARLCDVDERALPLLKTLALAGDELDTSTILALSMHTEAETLHLLDVAHAAGTLVVSGARYRFRHELVRQLLVEEIAPHQRLKIHRDSARRLATLNAAPGVIARHWLAAGSPAEATPWLLRAARDALRVGAFADALRQLEPTLAFNADHPDGLALRAEALDGLGNPGAVAAYKAAAAAAGEPASHDLLAKGALAQVKLGDAKGGLRLLEGLAPTSVQGRLSEALAYSGAAALGVADPAMGTRKAAEARRLALQTGDTAAIVVASWAQAAAAHARGELHRSVWADLHETSHVPHLAVRLFDGQLCITQRFLYGARPYPEVISFAQSLADEARRLGAPRGHAFGTTLRGEAELLAGDLDAAEEHLTLGARLHRDIGAPTGEAFSLQRLAEVALYRGRRDEARALLDQALDLARQTDIGFHLMDRIYGVFIALGVDAQAAFSALQDAEDAVRGPLETCPGCRITFAVPAAIAAARARNLERMAHYERAVDYLANVVMRLPAWYAAQEEVRGHLARGRGEDGAVAASAFAAAASRFRQAGQPLDAARCDALAAGTD